MRLRVATGTSGWWLVVAERQLREREREKESKNRDDHYISCRPRDSSNNWFPIFQRAFNNHCFALQRGTSSSLPIPQSILSIFFCLLHELRGFGQLAVLLLFFHFYLLPLDLSKLWFSPFGKKKLPSVRIIYLILCQSNFASLSITLRFILSNDA